PELADDADAVLDLIHEEVVLRGQHGEAAPLDEYLGRFPQFASQLRLQFELRTGLLTRATSPTAGPGPLPDGPRPVGADATPRTLPGLQILGELGAGGMGVVYKASQVALRRLVALKMILPGAATDPEYLERFQAEAEAVARLQHPNVVQI